MPFQREHRWASPTTIGGKREHTIVCRPQGRQPRTVPACACQALAPASRPNCAVYASGPG
jgi:hypothetical protein